MSESLKSILSALEHSREPSWTQYWMRDWPAGEFERCLATGLFVPQEPTDQIPCTVCGEIVDVLRITKPSGEIEACLKCSLCGNHRVPLAMAGRWDLNISLFVDLVAAALGATGGTQPLVRDRVWRLGGQLAHHRKRVDVLTDWTNPMICGDAELDGHRGSPHTRN